MTDLPPPEEGVLLLRISDLRTWLQCPRRFYFEVLNKLYPQPSSPAYDAADPEAIEYEIDTSGDEPVVIEREAKRRDEGTMAHAVVENYYLGWYDDYEFDPIGLTTAVAKTVTEKALTLTKDIDTKSWTEARRYAESMGVGFVQWCQLEGHDVGKQPVLVEERLSVDLPFRYGPYHTLRVTGQLDIAQYDKMMDQFSVGDTKTTTTLKKGGPREADFQLVGYSWLFQKNHPDKVLPAYAYQNLLLRSLRTSKSSPPYFKRVPISIYEDKVYAWEQSLRQQMVIMGRWIEQLHQGRPPDALAYSETQLCEWMCKTSLVCDAMSSGLKGRWQSVANAYYGGTFDEVFDD